MQNCIKAFCFWFFNKLEKNQIQIQVQVQKIKQTTFALEF